MRPGELEALGADRSNALHSLATAVARCTAVRNHLWLITMPHDRSYHSGEAAA